jgi:hypothetical protein
MVSHARACMDEGDATALESVRSDWFRSFATSSLRPAGWLADVVTCVCLARGLQRQSTIGHATNRHPRYHRCSRRADDRRGHTHVHAASSHTVRSGRTSPHLTSNAINAGQVKRSLRQRRSKIESDRKSGQQKEERTRRATRGRHMCAQRSWLQLFRYDAILHQHKS